MPETWTTLVARYRTADGIHHARRHGGRWQRLCGAPWSAGKPLPRWDDDAEITLLSPSEPTKILCIGLNDRARVAESHTVLPASAAAGVTCFDDISARNRQRSDGQWSRARGSDTFAPFGPWIAMGLDPSCLALQCRVNGLLRQQGSTRDLIFHVPRLVAHITRSITLEPGDVIGTGTPAGVAPIEAGDRIEVEVEGVGPLVHTIGAREA